MINTNLLDEDAKERTPEYRTWGQVASLNVWEAVWSVGAWLLFDSNIHQLKDKRVRIELLIIPIDEMNARYNVDQKFTQDNRDWAGVTLPSIKALTVPLGIKVVDVLNRFVLVKKVPNGKTYDKKGLDGQPTGEKGKLTDLIFEKIFVSQDECIADYIGDASGEPTTQASADAFPVDTPTTQVKTSAQNGPSIDVLINFARNFVKAAVKAHPGDLAAITAEVKHQMEVKNSAFFAGKLAADSPEVVAMISMEMGL
jgi:hypothetical protein